MPRYAVVGVLLWLLSTPAANAQLTDATTADYDQWKLALSKDGVAQPVTVQTLPGFRIEVVRVAAPGEGSWISLTCDPRGRLIVGREDRGLLRMTLADDGRSITRVESIDDTLLECRGLLFAHGSLYAHANNSKGLYRLRDTDGDDRFDEVRLLRKTEGGVGHGRNGLALGPDGMIYCALGNNVLVPDDVSPASPYRSYGQDRLVTAPWNELLFDGDIVPPAGHIVRTDPEGTRWELFAGGFRNPYGLAFNADGELFTYDADMEWDEGAPWYRPTTVMHVVAGGEYGWRQETSLWPDHFADLLPRALDIGLGSPTGVRFGDKSRFPEKYRRALYVLDWAYGRIIAVHLSPKGASYRATAETFIKGKPLNVCDLEIGHDGALYFVVGGRKTQSALYRVSHTGEPVKADGNTTPPAEDAEAALRRAFRRTLADVPRQPPAVAIGLDTAWSALASDDVWLRHAARVWLEQQGGALWTERALTEAAPNTAAHALLSLVRVMPAGLSLRVLDRLIMLLGTPQSAPAQEILLRALQVALARGAKLTPPQTSRLEPLLIAACATDRTSAEKQLAAELLVFLGTQGADRQLVDLLDQSRRQGDALTWLLYLNQVREPLSFEEQKRRLAWLQRADAFTGAHYMHTFVTFLRTDALASLSDAERTLLHDEIVGLGRAGEQVSDAPAPAATVTQWTMASLVPALAEVAPDRNLTRGRELFSRATCTRCHRLYDRGIPFGPDLDGVAARFGRKDLLETILDPSRAVDHKYRNVQIETRAGLVVTGQLAGGNRDALFIAEDPLLPSRVRRIPRTEIVNRTSPEISPMPNGLLNPLARDEIVDLLSYLEFGEKDTP